MSIVAPHLLGKGDGESSLVQDCHQKPRMGIMFRVGLLIALCVGSSFANTGFAVAQAASSEAAQPLRLVIAAVKSSYQVNEIPTTQYPRSKEAVISVTGEIQNISQQDQWFYVVESTATPTYHLTGPTGKPVEIAYRISDPGELKKEDFVLIKAGESLPKRFDVHFWTGDTVAPGVYTLSMAYQVWENWYFDDEQGARVDVNAWTGTLHSNEVKIEVH